MNAHPYHTYRIDHDDNDDPFGWLRIQDGADELEDEWDWTEFDDLDEDFFERQPELTDW